MFLWVSCKALGKGPYLTNSPSVLLPFLRSCPWDASNSFLSWYLLCSLRALFGTVSWLWQECHPWEGEGSSWDMLHLVEMALSSVRKGLWLSSVELMHKSWLLCWRLSVCVTPAPEGPEHVRLRLHLQRVVKAVHESWGGMEDWFLLTATSRNISAAGTCSSQKEGEDGCQQQHWTWARNGLRPSTLILCPHTTAVRSREGTLIAGSCSFPLSVQAPILQSVL